MDLRQYIEERRQQRKILLMAHVIAGYPSVDVNWRMLEIMADLDVDLVELQMPFSEPVADGPTFVRANQAAIEAGFKVDQYFALMKRSTSTFPFPHLMMVLPVVVHGTSRSLQEIGMEQFTMVILAL